jgi:hypothetical protein
MSGQLSRLLDGDAPEATQAEATEAVEAFERAEAARSQAESDANEGRRRLEVARQQFAEYAVAKADEAVAFGDKIRAVGLALVTSLQNTQPILGVVCDEMNTSISKMTASSMLRVNNVTPPGSELQQPLQAKHESRTASKLLVTILTPPGVNNPCRQNTSS